MRWKKVESFGAFSLRVAIFEENDLMTLNGMKNGS